VYYRSVTWRSSQTPSSESANNARAGLLSLFQNRPFTDEELQTNLTLFMRSGSLAKLLFINEVYEKIIDIPGAIFEFGTYLGATTVLFENFRAIHEPYDHLRRIYSFDTFEGYVKPDSIDAESMPFLEIISDGTYTTPKDYEGYLKQIIETHEKNNVMSHIAKHKIIKGDVMDTLPKILNGDKSIGIALIYFDLALYKPTKFALELCLEKLMPGGAIVFDELVHPDFPGETQVFFEILKSKRISIKKSRYLKDRSIITIH